MFKKTSLILTKIILFLLVILVMLKLLTVIPAKRLQPYLADKLIFLQERERKIERFFKNIKMTYREISRKEIEERKYKLLYEKVLTEKTLNRSLIFENRFLRKKLGFIRNFQYRLIPGEVIAHGADNWFRFLIVNKGQRDGIKRDMAVITNQGLIGYAETVFHAKTKVVLITDPQTQVSCINQRTKEIGIITGQLDNPLLVNYIGSSSDVKEGDIFLTSGNSFRYNRGLPVVKVVKVTTDRNNYYKRVITKPLADFSKLDIVFFVW